jgi:hypothetical protein
VNRRKLITYSLGTSAFIVLNKWHPPIVNSIVLPSHAQTSCSELTSPLFRISSIQRFNIEVSNSCPVQILSSSSNAADLVIELVNPALIGTVRAADITMNYSQNTRRHEFLPDSQSNNVPFTIELDNLEASDAQFTVNIELNYFQSTDVLEVTIEVGPA